MKEKWILMRDIKENYTDKDLNSRMYFTALKLINQGCKKMRTFIDVDQVVQG